MYSVGHLLIFYEVDAIILTPFLSLAQYFVINSCLNKNNYTHNIYDVQYWPRHRTETTHSFVFVTKQCATKDTDDDALLTS